VNVGDVILALSPGSAGALAFTAGVSTAVVGVMVAVAPSRPGARVVPSPVRSAQAPVAPRAEGAVAASPRPDGAKDDWRARPAAHVPVGAAPQGAGLALGTLPAEGRSPAAHVAAAAPGGSRVADPEMPAQGAAGLPSSEAQVAVRGQWGDARPLSARKTDGA
jgi:hypothetical protein